jgi:hypothetical protein
MLHSNNRSRGWVRGWAVYKGGFRPRFIGVFEPRDEAEAAAEKAGKGYEIRWGSYDAQHEDFVTSAPFENI